MEEAVLEVPFGTLRLIPDYDNKAVWFHAEATKWSPEIYKQSLDSWNRIIELCKINGFKYLASHIPNDNKIRKFQTMFGLEPHAETPEGLIFRMVI